MAEPTNTTNPSLLARVARAICCGDGPCHVEEIKKREGGQYLTDLPCYATSPDVTKSACLAASIALEEAAKIADDHTPAKHDGTLAAHVTGCVIASSIRAALTDGDA